MYKRQNKGRAAEEIDPFQVVLLIIFVVAALIFPCYKFVRLVIWQARAHKPQSKKDAALAQKFKLPKHNLDMQACIEVFKAQEKSLLQHGAWTKQDMETITAKSNEVLRYLRHRVDQAVDLQQVRTMQCCLKMDVLYDFKTLYDLSLIHI